MNINKFGFKAMAWVLALVCLAIIPVSGQAQNSRKRILFIPLDDRPPCLQFTVKMGEISDAEVVTPPKEILGRFTIPGQPEAIAEWIKTQKLESFDAAIIVFDMVAYGGLVASRVHGETDAVRALSRVEIVRELRRKAPKLPIYGQNVIMRLAPTGTGANEVYRGKLVEWAEVSPYADEKSKAQTARLVGEIPAEVLADYKRARERNLKVNLQAIDYVRDGVIDYLILSQDDAKPRGIHVADRERLIKEIKRRNLAEKIAVQPGADEVSMLLLARVLNKLYGFSPKVKAVYSSTELSNKVMPFEDRALRETVSFHIKATGSREVENEKEPDLLFYVYASRFEAGRAQSFAKEIQDKLKQNKRVIVADIDPKGDVQGGDPAFTEALEKLGVFADLNGYASWNTAGNTIGTALPQGVVFALAQNKLLKFNQAVARIATAQNWFTFHRMLDDYYFHTLVRAKARDYIVENKWSTLRLTDDATQKVESFSLALMQPFFAQLSNDYFQKQPNNTPKNIRCDKPTALSLDLPWNRTFEAEIDFKLQCRVVNGGKN